MSYFVEFSQNETAKRSTIYSTALIMKQTSRNNTINSKMQR